jgi:hypothetical protein
VFAYDFRDYNFGGGNAKAPRRGCVREYAPSNSFTIRIGDENI